MPNPTQLGAKNGDLHADTKNRSDHKLLLSRQALEIAKRNCSGRKAQEPLFPVIDARKTLARINERAGTTVQGHGLRATTRALPKNWSPRRC
jgi:hypothetical protein